MSRLLLAEFAILGLAVSLAGAQPAPAPAPPPARPLPPAVTLVGEGGADGFVAAGPDGVIHAVCGGKYRQGLAPDRLGAAESITDAGPVHTVRVAVDRGGQPHVVFTSGVTDNAKRSYYTTRVAGRWLPAEKFADAADFPHRTRAYVADVAVDEAANVLVAFWVSRPAERRGER